MPFEFEYLSYYAPLLGLSAILVMFFLTFGRPANHFPVTIGVPPISTQVFVPHRWIVQAVLVCTALSLIAFALCRDYSGYYKRDVIYDVTFDNAAIHRALRDLNAYPQIAELIDTNWVHVQDSLCIVLDKRIGFDPSLGRRYFSSSTRTTCLTGVGRATHRLARAGQWQRYEFLEVTGTVDVLLSESGREPVPQIWRYQLAQKVCDS